MLLSEGLVRGCSVALVGNSAAILRGTAGHQIDHHDVVIRMNLGLPFRFMPRVPEAIGSRTTIWATAKHWPGVRPPKDCKASVWMKLTDLGRQQFPLFLAEIPSELLVDIWPQDLEDECREYVGADPGTGIRMLWWLKTKAKPRSVSCFGMDCWETPTSHWSGKGHTKNHDPDLERAAMLRLL